MRCLGCLHDSLDVAPKYCSECGARFPDTAARRAPAGAEPGLDSVREVEPGEESRTDAPGELRGEVPPCPKAGEDNLPPTSGPMGPFQEKAGASLTKAQKNKRKKRNRKNKNKNSNTKETDSLTSLISESNSLDCEASNVNPEQVDSLTAPVLEAPSDASVDLNQDNMVEGSKIQDKKLLPSTSGASSIGHLISANINTSSTVEQQVLLTSSGVMSQSLVNSVPAKRISEKSQPQGVLTQAEQPAATLTESSPDVNGNCAGCSSSFPIQAEVKNSGAPQAGSATPSAVGKIGQYENAEGENSTLEAASSTQPDKKEKTPGSAQSAKDINGSIQTRSAVNNSYAAALKKESAAASGEFGDDATHDSKSITERPMTEDESEEGKTGQASLENVKGVHIVPEETKPPKAVLSNGKGKSTPENAAQPSKEGKEEGECSKIGKESQADMKKGKGQPNSKKVDEGQAVSEKEKEGKDISEKEKGNRAVSEKEIEDQEVSKKEKKGQAITEKKKNDQAVSQKNPEEVTENQQAKIAPPSNEKNNNHQVGASTRPLNPEDCVIVYFHAIISKDFKLHPNKDKVAIRAEGITGSQKWKDYVCRMKCSKNLEEHGKLFEGFMRVPKKDLHKCIPYKYCIVRGNKNEYEYIYKQDAAAIVNRCLNIPRNDLSQGEWHQYDDIVCARQEKGIMKHLSGWFGWNDKTKSLLKGKDIAGEIMLESLFSVLSTLDSTNLKSFLTQLHQFYLVWSNPMVHEGMPKEWLSLQFGQKEVNVLILKALQKVAQPFLDKINANAMPENTIVKDRLAAGLIILTVCEHYKLLTSKEQLNQLCILLCPEKMDREEILTQVESMRDMFSSVLNMKQCLMNLCHHCINEKVDLWVWLLPLLHFSSFNPDQMLSLGTNLPQEDIWAGLEGFEFHTFRDHFWDRKDLLQSMKSKQYLLEMDRVLGRSWFCLLPLQNLAEFLSGRNIDVLDMLVGTYHRLKADPINHQNNKNVQALLEMLLKIMDLPEGSDRQQTAVRISLKIHSDICKNTKGFMYHEIPALSACVFFKFSRSASSEDSKEMLVSAQPEGPKVDETLQKVLKDTKTWITAVLNYSTLYQISLRDELKTLWTWEIVLGCSFWKEPDL